MKVYISADIEGVAGITNWNEADKNHPDYPEFRALMTAEVVAACEGAITAGATEILIKDAHDTGRNLLLDRLPDCARIIRGWSGHPFSMVQELDNSFQAVIMLGYHAKAGTDDNPLAHTLRMKVARIKLNGALMSEFVQHSYAAATCDVPVVFVSGDKGICTDAHAFNPGITTAAVSEGRGPSTISVSPARARQMIRDGVASAFENAHRCRVRLPDNFDLEIEYANPIDAYRASWYPGARYAAPRLVQFAARDYFDILRALKFLLVH